MCVPPLPLNAQELFRLRRRRNCRAAQRRNTEYSNAKDFRTTFKIAPRCLPGTHGIHLSGKRNRVMVIDQLEGLTDGEGIEGGKDQGVPVRAWNSPQVQLRICHWNCAPGSHHEQSGIFVRFERMWHASLDEKHLAGAEFKGRLRLVEPDMTGDGVHGDYFFGRMLGNALPSTQIQQHQPITGTVHQYSGGRFLVVKLDKLAQGVNLHKWLLFPKWK